MIAWLRPAPRTASSPNHLARYQDFGETGSTLTPEQYTYRLTPADAAAATSRSVPRWSNSSKVNPRRGFSTGYVGNVST
jgi:hypothetical protein